MVDTGIGTDIATKDETEFNDPDAYKDDWYDSLVFKRAMKTEAIKRGVRYDSDFSVDDANEHIEMTTANKGSCSPGPKDNITNSKDDILENSEVEPSPSVDENS